MSIPTFLCTHAYVFDVLKETQNLFCVVCQVTILSFLCFQNDIFYGFKFQIFLFLIIFISELRSLS